MQPPDTLFDIFTPLGLDRVIDQVDWFDSAIKKVEVGIVYACNQ